MSKDKFDFPQAQAETWVKFGVLEPVRRGETFVVSQPVVVAKRGKDDVVTGYRAAFDFRKLNAVLEQDKLAPEPVRNIAEHAARAWRTTSLDATALFNQFELDEDSRFLTTVMIRPGAYYRFRCAPFGLSSILGFAQHALDEFIRADDRAVKVYVDDIVIAHCEPGDWHAAAEELLRVLRRCSERNLALNADKAELFQSKLIVVGHAIDCDTHTFRPRPARLQALAEFPRRVDRRGDGGVSRGEAADHRSRAQARVESDAADVRVHGRLCVGHRVRGDTAGHAGQPDPGRLRRSQDSGTREQAVPTGARGAGVPRRRARGAASDHRHGDRADLAH
jgi:hypothetical protein